MWRALKGTTVTHRRNKTFPLSLRTERPQCPLPLSLISRAQSSEPSHIMLRPDCTSHLRDKISKCLLLSLCVPMTFLTCRFQLTVLTWSVSNEGSDVALICHWKKKNTLTYKHSYVFSLIHTFSYFLTFLILVLDITGFANNKKSLTNCCPRKP